MAKWLPLLPPIAAVLLAVGFYWHGTDSNVDPELSARPLAIVVLAGIYVFAGRQRTAR